MLPQSAVILFPFAFDVHLSKRPFKLGFKAIIRNIASEPHQDTTDYNTHAGRMWVLFRNGMPIARGFTGRREVEALIPAQYFEFKPDDTMMFQLLDDPHGNARVKVSVFGHAEFAPGAPFTGTLVPLPTDEQVRAQMAAQATQG